ncbi:hypothetical protein O1611_g7429 [Lasiodiplodia mahajangana]|uniref:Uncharacterized protein n=1 Tax=Lasiodiplodia mahajangana TaxID=1108764 RepID=A0ACC2JFT7_9PEZI|nr:hypothetical protein O1611_g7429 [Lasiodiplodia mahajangana]
MPEITTFSSYRPGASQRPVPPPLNLEQQQLLLPPVHEGYVKTPFPPRADSASSQRSAFKPDDQSVEQQQQKQRSGLGGFGTPRRSSTLNSPRPPPGFTEVFSQIDSQGVVSPVPRVKNILSKARQGLGIGSDESRKERRREEFKRQIRRQNEA